MQITGESSSRLVELKKYTITDVFSRQYITGGSVLNDGVDINNTSVGNYVTYYIGGIKYIDVLSGVNSGITYNIYTPLSDGNSINFTNSFYYKDPKNGGSISKPKIDNDVFIVRQEISAFENNYRLEYIKNLNDLMTYAGGNYFKIINNK